MFIDPEHKSLIKDSGLFDGNWYRTNYQDVGMTGMDALDHFILFGGVLGRNPSLQFDAAAYLETNPDVKEAGINPLLHYLKFGMQEGRKAFIVVPRVDAVERAATKLAENRKVVTPDQRVVVFAAYEKDEIIPERTLYYLRALRTIADRVIYVCDNALPQKEADKIKDIVVHHIGGPHGEYDFGSYKLGYNHADRKKLLEGAEELIFCNDSCYGPVTPLTALFDRMSFMDCDFWGISDSSEIAFHLQSYFLCFNKAVFEHACFKEFMQTITRQPSVTEVIQKYEVGLSQLLLRNGFKVACRVTTRAAVSDLVEKTPRFNLNYPLHQLEAGSPLVKSKALQIAHYNLDGVDRTLDRIRDLNPELHRIIVSDPDIARFQSAGDVRFSIVMPVFNRAQTVAKAIDSVLAQTHQNFELIIVDDGSSDASAAVIHKYLYDPRIRYIASHNNGGVSEARNIGLAAARHEWIAYLDSDNALRRNFLTVFANCILNYSDKKLFYARFCLTSDGTVLGAPYDRQKLVYSNFIDLGVFVHHRSIYEALGGFDTSLKRLVDWELILKYTKKHFPVFIPRVLMEYSDDGDDKSRISVSESFTRAFVRVRSRYSSKPIVTTAIVSYNHKDYIEKAIEAALAQKGNFIHEILIADDGSTDGTADIAQAYAAQHPTLIRLIGGAENVGISRNFQRCFANASGDYIAILEADDYWNSDNNLKNKMEFLKSNSECSMVFSKLQMLNQDTGKVNYLERQLKLKKNKLNGDDFIADPDMNLIVNFSSCLFRTELMRTLPDRIYNYRLSEIALAFHLEAIGPIGYLDEPLTVYRVHSSGTWSGLSLPEKLKSQLTIREIVRDIARPDFTARIDQIIEDKFRSKLRALEPHG